MGKKGNNICRGFLEKYLTTLIKNTASGGTSVQCCRTLTCLCSVESDITALLFVKMTASLPSSQ